MEVRALQHAAAADMKSGVSKAQRQFLVAWLLHDGLPLKKCFYPA